MNPIALIILIYRGSYLIGFILMMIFNIFKYYKVFNISRLRAAVYGVATFAYGVLGGIVISELYNAVAALKGEHPEINIDLIGAVIFELLWIPTVYAVNYFIKLMNKRLKTKNANQTEIKRISFRDTFDFIVPGAFIICTFIKIGCFFSGCCYGVECSWGVYSWITDTTLFPIQIFEAATILLILIAMYFIKQTKFYRRGMAGPLTVAMYMFARFCWEFLRGYTPEMRHFFLGLSLWQIFCLIVLIVVVVWIIVLYKTQPSEPKPKGYLLAKYDKKTVNSKEK